MERRLRREEVMTIEVLHERGMSNRAIGRQLGVHENAVRYRLRRLASGAVDGRSAKTHSAEPWAEQLACLQDLECEFGYGGAANSVTLTTSEAAITQPAATSER